MGRERSTGRCARALLSAAVVAGVVVPAGTASATTTGLLAGGQALDGGTVAPGATVSLAAPAAAVVSWVLDGVYVGRDSTAPFELALRTAPGAHRLRARAKTASGVQTTYEARFTTQSTAPAPAPSPAPAPAPSGTTRTITSTDGLVSALRSARPGDVLQLADGTYSGRFVASVSGTATAPIVLRGSPRAVLDGGAPATGYALHLNGASHWRLEGFTVRGAQKGVVLDRSSHNVLARLDVGRTGMEAVHFRTASSDNRLEASAVHDTGLVEGGYGEGVYIGSAMSNWGTYGGGGPDRSDRNSVVGNRIWATTAESVDIKEGTTGGLLADNTFDGAGITGEHFGDSWVDVKGNGYRILRNTGTNSPRDGFQTHVQLAGWGRDNVFSANRLTVNAAGYGIHVAKPTDTNNRVSCDNVVEGAASGTANVACR